MQSITPDHLQGRSNATRRSINRTMIVIGAPLGGVLADAVGYRATLYGAAVGFGLVASSLAISPYRHARLDDTARTVG
jgi:predicted MFS family arabinose efflux permease